MGQDPRAELSTENESKNRRRQSISCTLSLHWFRRYAVSLPRGLCRWLWLTSAQNYGAKRDLTIGNVPIGRLIMHRDAVAAAKSDTGGQTSEAEPRQKDGSIIIVLATDVSRLSLSRTMLGAKDSGTASSYATQAIGCPSVAFRPGKSRS